VTKGMSPIVRLMISVWSVWVFKRKLRFSIRSGINSIHLIKSVSIQLRDRRSECIPSELVDR
jgi:hypothetical protein